MVEACSCSLTSLWIWKQRKGKSILSWLCPFLLGLGPQSMDAAANNKGGSYPLSYSPWKHLQGDSKSSQRRGHHTVLLETICTLAGAPYSRKLLKS